MKTKAEYVNARKAHMRSARRLKAAGRPIGFHIRRASFWSALARAAS